MEAINDPLFQKIDLPPDHRLDREKRHILPLTSSAKIEEIKEIAAHHLNQDLPTPPSPIHGYGIAPFTDLYEESLPPEEESEDEDSPIQWHEVTLAAKEALKEPLIEGMEKEITVNLGNRSFTFLAREKRGMVKLYFIGSQLGTGAFGAIYQVLHPDKPNKQSVFKKHLTLDDFRNRFHVPLEGLDNYILRKETEIREAKEKTTLEQTGLIANLEKEISEACEAERMAIAAFNSAKGDIRNEYLTLHLLHQGKKEPLYGIMNMPSRFIVLAPEMVGQETVEGYLAPRYLSNYRVIGKVDKLTEQTLQQSLFVFHQLSGGLAFLHSQDVIHGDIKNDNVLVLPPDQEGLMVAHLADFGKSVRGGELQDGTKGLSETFSIQAAFNPYCLKEDMEKQKSLLKMGDKKNLLDQEKKRDDFALGCTFYSALQGKLPYSSTNPDLKTAEIRGWRKAGKVEDLVFDPLVPPAVVEIIQGLLRPDSAERLDALQAYHKLNLFIMATYPDLYQKLIKLPGSFKPLPK